MSSICWPGRWRSRPGLPEWPHTGLCWAGAAGEGNLAADKNKAYQFNPPLISRSPSTMSIPPPVCSRGQFDAAGNVLGNSACVIVGPTAGSPTSCWDKFHTPDWFAFRNSYSWAEYLRVGVPVHELLGACAPTLYWLIRVLMFRESGHGFWFCREAALGRVCAVTRGGLPGVADLRNGVFGK